MQPTLTELRESVNRAFFRLQGQKQAVELLQSAVLSDRIAPAYLFAGPPGVGRSLAAKCFCELLLGQGLTPEKRLRLNRQLEQRNHPDLLWVEPTYVHQGQRLSAGEAAAAGLKRKAPPQIRIEQIREIVQFLGRPPLEADRAIVVIEDAEAMAEAAANALLKTLEEPGRATLILIASGADVLLPTLVSRCQRLPFTRLTPADMEQVLRHLGRAEILNDIGLLALAQGSPGAAILASEQLQEASGFLAQLTTPPTTAIAALTLARDIDKQLDAQTQLWLLDYLQSHYWQTWRHKAIAEQGEQARQSLLAYVQPRLVWECFLLSLSQLAGK